MAVVYALGRGFLLLLMAGTLPAFFGKTTLEAAEPRPNVLFIAVDDLRPQLACYGRREMVTPNLDRLAASGLLFERAYCMVPTCGASRASLMSGMRPKRQRFVSYTARADKDAQGIVTLNTHFKQNGYHTISLGKVFHFPQDNVHGWSEQPWRPDGVTYANPEHAALAKKRAQQRGRKGRGPAFESADVPDETYRDGRLARKAVADLKRLKQMDKPFFLAVGFFKPHLPFVAPKKYWDLYPHEDIRLPANYSVPVDAPKEAIHTSGELRAYADVPRKGPVSDEFARNLIHGYKACVSYTDAQVGLVLDTLTQLDLEKNTIVVLWDDHGWNLGEHTLWCKHCCFETSMQVPLLVRAPGIPGGRRTRGLTELIDIYPSLCELAGLPAPEHLQGTSFEPLLSDPDIPWKRSAIGRFQAGDTIRTDRYRFSEYTARDGKFLGNMLYNHEDDPAETRNISKQPDEVPRAKKLARQLHEVRKLD